MSETFDVVICGGAMMGTAAAWFIAQHPQFDGRIAVIERDPSFAHASTSATNSCIRQQFGTALNIRISQFAAHYIKTLPEQMGGLIEAPSLDIRNFGYLYLARTEAQAERLRRCHALQTQLGAGTELLDPDALRARFPAMALDDVRLGSHNTVDEGYWDGAALFDAWRRGGAQCGVTRITGEITALERDGPRINAVRLKDGTRIGCGHLVNATGPNAARIAALAGVPLPVEPRKRHTWVFRARTPLPHILPLTIDPSGVHVRQDGPTSYMAGGHSTPDGPCAADDFAHDPDLWQETVWPALAARVPAFAEIRLEREWVGHYAWNPFDQNAIIGPHPGIANLHFINGFSGHGLQQAPAMGRGLAERLITGQYHSLDLTPFAFARIADGTPIREEAVI